MGQRSTQIESSVCYSESMSVPVVCVVDGDELVRAGLKELFESVGLNVLLFNSPSIFLQSNLPDSPCCVLLDVRMPEMSGLKLQEELAKADVQVPSSSSPPWGRRHGGRAMKAGAVDFLSKPFHNQDLLDAVFAALSTTMPGVAKQESISTLQSITTLLSVREKEVLSHVAAGQLNKQIAAELGISEVMVKVHRAKGMRKLHAKSVAELVRMTDLLTMPAT